MTRGGSTDARERAQMGAEALTLIGLLGKHRVPELWSDRVIHDDDGLQALIDDPDTEHWQANAIEARLAVNAILRDMDQVSTMRVHRRRKAAS